MAMSIIPSHIAGIQNSDKLGSLDLSDIVGQAARDLHEKKSNQEDFVMPAVVLIPVPFIVQNRQVPLSNGDCVDGQELSVDMRSAVKAESGNPASAQQETASNRVMPGLIFAPNVRVPNDVLLSFFIEKFSKVKPEVSLFKTAGVEVESKQQVQDSDAIEQKQSVKPQMSYMPQTRVPEMNKVAQAIVSQHDRAPTVASAVDVNISRKQNNQLLSEVKSVVTEKMDASESIFVLPAKSPVESVVTMPQTSAPVIHQPVKQDATVKQKEILAMRDKDAAPPVTTVTFSGWKGKPSVEVKGNAHEGYKMSVVSDDKYVGQKTTQILDRSLSAFNSGVNNDGGSFLDVTVESATDSDQRKNSQNKKDNDDE